MKLSGNPSDEVVHAWEDVKAMFNGGTRKRLLQNASGPKVIKQLKIDLSNNTRTHPLVPAPQVPSIQDIPIPLSRMAMDFMYHKPFAFSPYNTLPWLKRNPILFSHDSPILSVDKQYHSAFKPVQPTTVHAHETAQKEEPSDDDIDIETTDEKQDAAKFSVWSPKFETAI